MNQLQSIVILLQLVLSLLSKNPSAANQALATQAIVIATQSVNATLETQQGASLETASTPIISEDIQAEQLPTSTSPTIQCATYEGDACVGYVETSTVITPYYVPQSSNSNPNAGLNLGASSGNCEVGMSGCQ